MFNLVQPAALPDDALLARYRQVPGAFTDCYLTTVPEQVTLARFVTAFYTAPLFRMERWVLAALARSPSTDAEAAEIGAGARDKFAAWSTEDRTETQLLMCAKGARTRSWFNVVPEVGGTRLYFGSAVVPANGAPGNPPTLGFGFDALHGLHGFYSKALLTGARRHLQQ